MVVEGLFNVRNELSPLHVSLHTYCFLQICYYSTYFYTYVTTHTLHILDGTIRELRVFEGNLFVDVRSQQRFLQRWLDKRIYKTEMKFWAVLGSQGCREKKLPTAISTYATFWGVFLNLLWAKKKGLIFF